MEKHLSKPTISVVMSVYNGEFYLKEAIDSVLAQTYRDFELLIIDDGSTDKSNKIIKSYDDKRIRLIEQKNKGLVESLNRGIQESRGVYIARQDADDASRHTRFEKQLEFLGKSPGTVIVGSSMVIMDETSKILHGHKVLLHDTELRQELLIRSPFAHGSVMFRREQAIKAGLYDQDFWPAEDYEFWLRLSQYGKLANIDEPLYIYRENSKGISSSNKQLQDTMVRRINSMAWEQRKRLVGGRLLLSRYKKDERLQRVVDNLKYGLGMARKNKDLPYIFRIVWSTSLESAIYRRIFGKISDKVKRR